MNLPEITKKEFLFSITLGVKAAVLEMTEPGDGYCGPIIREPFFKAIRQGTQDSIWQIATNATSAPCADFYDMIKQGVKEGTENLTVNCRKD